MSAFRVVGVILVLGLIAWLIGAAVLPIGRHPTPELIGLGSAFEGNLQLPMDKIKAAFEEARQHMLEVNDWGTMLRLAGNLAGWLSFAATAAITLIVGFYGRSIPASGRPVETEGLSARSVRTIGFLAALAAVLTAFGSLSVAKSQEYFKQADEIRDLVVHARAQVIDAPSADAAQAVLDDLALKSKR
jgi:hypothetical protein